MTRRSCIQRKNVKHINVLGGVLHESPFISSYLLPIFHFTLRSESLLIAVPVHVIRILLRDVPVLVRKRPFTLSSFSFRYLVSSFTPNSAIPNCYAVEITKRSLSFLRTQLRVQGATKPQASLRAISGSCVPHYVVFVHPQNHFQSPSSGHHPCPRPTNFSK